jgi:hypothetical protein
MSRGERRRWGRTLSLVLVLTVLSLCWGARWEPSAAQAPTPTPQITALPTSTTRPPVFQVQTADFKLFELDKAPFEFIVPQVGLFAVSAAGNIYIPDGQANVLVFGADLKYQRSFAAPVPVHVGITPARDRLLVGLRYPAAVVAYTFDGTPQETLWQIPHSYLDSLAIAPNGEMLVIIRNEFKPYPLDMLRLDAQGNVLFQRPFAARSTPNDVISGITFNADGSYYVSLVGFDRPTDRSSIVYYTATGDLVTTQRPPFSFGFRLSPVMLPIRLENGQFVLVGTVGIGWWRPDGSLIEFLGHDRITGYIPRFVSLQQYAATVGADGETIYFTFFISPQELILGRIALRRLN